MDISAPRGIMKSVLCTETWPGLRLTLPLDRLKDFVMKKTNWQMCVYALS